MRLHRPPCWPTRSPMLPCPSWWMPPPRRPVRCYTTNVARREPLEFFSKTFSVQHFRSRTLSCLLRCPTFQAFRGGVARGGFYRPSAVGVGPAKSFRPVHGTRDSATRFLAPIRVNASLGPPSRHLGYNKRGRGKTTKSGPSGVPEPGMHGLSCKAHKCSDAGIREIGVLATKEP